MTENIEVVESLGSSDHQAFEFSVITQVQFKIFKEYAPVFLRAIFQTFSSDFSPIESRELFYGTSIDQKMSGKIFSVVIQYLRQMHP